MKICTAFFLTTLITLFVNPSWASIEWDGCYQLYLPNVMYPALCLDGTSEEGIGGAGARIVIFHTNTDRISGCGVSSALAGSADRLEFIALNSKQLILSEAKMISSHLEGTATIGSTKLKFFKLDSTTSQRLLGKFHAEKRCHGLNVGTIIQLK